MTISFRANRIKLSLALGCAMLAAFASPAQPRLLQWRLGRSVNESTYVGAAACAKCHAAIAARYARSAMAHALAPGAACETLHARAPLAFTRNGVTWRIERAGEGFAYSVSDGTETLRMPLLWCFGHGGSGHTFVVQYEGVYYESRVSYFTSLRGLDITPGATRAPSSSLKASIGQAQRNAETQGCIACHSTALPGTAGLTLDRFQPTLQCEACHGPGSAHLAAQAAGDSARIRQAIFNPSRWTPDEMNQQFCGACHRSWETVMQLPEQGGLANVRFQPYRLANSKCYGNNPDDRRIACIACHDPHAPLVRETATYDGKCLACHRGGDAAPASPSRTAPACRTGKRDCASCHMPRVEPDDLHFKFTDHQIRIARPGEPYPR